MDINDNAITQKNTYDNTLNIFNEIICKLVDFIVNIKDLNMLARLEIASDYLQMPRLANLAYMQACQVTLERYTKQDLHMRQQHQQLLILDNFYSRFDTVT